MKNTFFFIIVTLTSLVYSQNKFTYNETGLNPKYVLAKIDNKAQSELYIKTIEWIKKTYKYPEKVITAKIENESLQLTSVKNNVIHVDKQYFHIKYTIKISFKAGQYSFEPLMLQSKVNSKYNMGWKEIDIKNGALFFKKGKAIKRTKSYIKNIPEILNELNADLYNYLIKHN